MLLFLLFYIKHIFFLFFLFYCSVFCHTLTWISHGFTCVPHHDPPSCLPPHPIPLGLPSAPALRSTFFLSTYFIMKKWLLSFESSFLLIIKFILITEVEGWGNSFLASWQKHYFLRENLLLSVETSNSNLQGEVLRICKAGKKHSFSFGFFL